MDTTETTLLPSQPFANVMLDTAFKISFGAEHGRENMLNLLGVLLPEKHITDIKYVDKEHPGLFLSEKKSIFDLECRAGDESFVVEMQVEKKSSFQDRVLYYSTFLLREQLMTPLEEMQARRGKKKKSKDNEIADYRLKPVYVVSILNFSLKHSSAAALDRGLVSHYAIRNVRADENMTDALHFVFLELGRMKYKPEEDVRCKDALERLAFTIKNGKYFQKVPETFGDDAKINNLLKTMEIMKYTDEQRRRYEAEFFAELEKKSELKAAREDGLEQGIQQGIEKGMEKGLEQGKLQMAKELKAAKVEVEIISRASGLTVEEVEAL